MHRDHYRLQKGTTLSWSMKVWRVLMELNDSLFGHCFDLVTDHKPLLTLFNQHKSTSEQASARICRYGPYSLPCTNTLFISRRLRSMAMLDALSRLPNLPVPEELVLLLEHLEDSPVTAKKIESWTWKELVLLLEHLEDLPVTAKQIDLKGPCSVVIMCAVAGQTGVTMISFFKSTLWGEPKCLCIRDICCGELEWLFPPRIGRLSWLNLMRDIQVWLEGMP